MTSAPEAHKTAGVLDLLPCPFCGNTPDIHSPVTFQDSQGSKWGAVICCCTGPEVRTGYGPVEEWRDDAIEAWNTRSTPSVPAVAELSGDGLPQPTALGAAANGWVLVPLHPTDAMVEAGRIEGWDDPDHEASSLGHPWVREAVYEAMVAARPAATAPSAAERDVLAERRRQVTEEGWTPEHDDEHEGGELADAAACYAATAAGAVWADAVPSMWPWDRSSWKPRSAREDLVRAGALILAEIERLDRAALEGKSNA